MNLIFQCSTDDAAIAWLLRLAGDGDDQVKAVADKLRDLLVDALVEMDGRDHDVRVTVYVPQTQDVPDDLITLAEAATLCDQPSIQSISQAVARGTLTRYANPAADLRQGRTLISRSEFEAWRRSRGWE